MKKTIDNVEDLYEALYSVLERTELNPEMVVGTLESLKYEIIKNADTEEETEEKGNTEDQNEQEE